MKKYKAYTIINGKTFYILKRGRGGGKGRGGEGRGGVQLYIYVML